MFTKSEPQPLLVEPENPLLPEATIGKPYTARFTTDAKGSAVWNVVGHLQLDSDAKPRDGRHRDPCGLHLDPKTGELTGTPNHAGVFTR